MCVKDITAAYDRRMSSDTVNHLREGTRTDTHPFLVALASQAQEQQRMAYLASTDTIVPYRRDQTKPYYSGNNDRRDDRSDDRRDYRRDDYRDDPQ